MSSESTKTTHELMKRVKRNDESAFQALFNMHWEPLFYMAKAIMGDEDIAKDMVQEVWVDFWERKAKINNINIEAYLKQAIKYKVYNELRNRPLNVQHKEYLNSIETNESADDSLIYQQTHNTITSSVEELPERCREIFMMSREENLSNAEIADQLNISKRTVETHISIALKNLRLRLTSFLFGFLF